MSMQGSGTRESGAAVTAVPPVPPAELVDAVLSLAVTGVGVDGQRRAITAALDAGAEPDCATVVDRLLDIADRPPKDSVERARAALAARRAVVLLPGYAGYPPRLADAWPELGAPLWLFRCGGPSVPSLPTAPGRDPLWDLPAVAIVGTRRPTADGMRTAEALAAAVGGAGALVVSGLARGIDQAAHRAALEAGGSTVAVLGTGFGVDYPRGTDSLREKVGGSAGLLSELLPGLPPRPQHFLARNRIIAGLADLTVVVEGRPRSGALHTARMAAGQGRDVWAVPGSINAPVSQAPLALIRDGANVVTAVEDVVEAIGLSTVNGQTSALPGLAPSVEPRGYAVPTTHPVDAAILRLVGTVPASIDELVTRSGYPVAEVMQAVGRMRRNGHLDHTPGGIVRGKRPVGA